MSVQQREVTRTVMANVMVCDRCDAVGPEQYLDLQPAPTGWVYVKHDVDSRDHYREALTFCSWRCAEYYAASRQTEGEA